MKLLLVNVFLTTFQDLALFQSRWQKFRLRDPVAGALTCRGWEADSCSGDRKRERSRLALPPGEQSRPNCHSQEPGRFR